MVTEKVKKYFYGTGRRKSAVARVRIMPGKGQISINKADFITLNDFYLAPMKACGISNYDVTVIIKGGGITSRREAIRHGISRALILLDPELKPTLRKLGFITRDPREKERKKPGLKRARRAPQFAKR